MEDRAALLVPGRGLDSWSYPLVVGVLDGMPSGVWALFQGVFDDVGPDNDRVEDPAFGLVPAQACAEDAGEHADQLLLRSDFSLFWFDRSVFHGDCVPHHSTKSCHLTAAAYPG